MVATRLVGKVVAGRIELVEPLDVPDGTAVVVTVDRPPPTAEEIAAFMSQPAIGMWEDREDMKDPVEWVRKLRERCQDRNRRQD